MCNNNDEDLAKILAHLDFHGVKEKDELIDLEKPSYSKRKKKVEAPDAPRRSQWEHEAEYEIDLHGDSVEEADFKVREAFQLMAKTNQRTLRIIHGGRGGHYGPVKKRVHWLLEAALAKYVVKKRVEAHNDGSTWVLLNLDEMKTT